MTMKRILLLLTSIFIILQGCDRKFSTENLIAPNSGSANISGDTVYVQLNPVWGGFNNPQDIYIGHDQFLYVADTDNDRVVMMNVAGQVLGSLAIQKPIAIAQDFRLNLFVCAEFDTLGKTFSAVYRIDLFAVGNQISEAVPIRLLPRASDLNKPNRKYTAVTTFYNNMLYVARTGPDNGSFFDPDNSILMFVPKSNFGRGDGDTLIGRVPNIDAVSSGFVTANGISSLTSFDKRNIDVVVTLTGTTNFKAQQWNYVVSNLDEKYVTKFAPKDSVAFAKPNRFEQPEGCTIDASGNIFVVDAAKDSVYKFNAFGNELQSFGGSDIFNQPHGVAFFDRTLYIADSGNNRILRFILSTDIQ